MYAFISYQTGERAIAGRLKELLATFGVRSFLAHEDIEVSEEWRLEIIAELGKADLFIPLLSKAYMQSVWCVQESGIAAYMEGVTIIPLSLDGTIPPGFIGHVQSKKVDPKNVTMADLLPGLAKHDIRGVIANLTESLTRSRSFRGAETDFQQLLPFLGKATVEEKVAIVEAAAGNGQVLHAGLVARDYLPPIFRAVRRQLSAPLQERVQEALDQYAE